MKRSSLCLRLCAALSLAVFPPLAALAQEKPKQLVLVSFDGAGPSAMWAWSRDLARRSGAHFTYFLSCTMVIDRETGKTYRGPGQKPGRSNIGFAPDKAEAAARLDHIWQAVGEGNEIGSHTCGHFDGGQWSAAEWTAEFDTFRAVVENAWVTAGAGEREPEGWRAFVREGISGFRAPYLSQGPGLMTALKAGGFAYDASLVTDGPRPPETASGLPRFGLPMVPEGPKGRRVIAMDYNLYARHSGAKDNLADAKTYEERAYTAFRAAFDREYEGGRVPLQVGLHFTEMNGGAYWRALERLVLDVCGKPDVACVTYRDALRLMGGEGKTEAARAGL